MNNYTLLRQGIMAFCLMLCMLASGCGSSSQNEPGRYSLQFQAHPQINNSAPLKVRVLLLKSNAEFKSSDFYSLQNNEQAVLGASLLNSEEFFLISGKSTNTLSGNSSPEARYIGVIAEYQVLDGKKWRVSIPLPQPGKKSFWQFWKLSKDNELQASLYLDINGIRVVQQ